MLFGTDLEAMSDNQINADQLDHAISNLDQHILAWRKRGPVGKLHCIVRYIRSSPQRRRAFESRQEEAEVAPTGDPRAFDVLQWWIEHLYDYPQLSKMALDLLACPAMSADCERAFSSAGRSVSKTRSRINDETAEATECLRSWLKQGWIDTERWIVNGGMNKEDLEGEDDIDEDG